VCHCFDYESGKAAGREGESENLPDYYYAIFVEKG
jgi:hypothetical protein